MLDIYRNTHNVKEDSAVLTTLACPLSLSMSLVCYKLIFLHEALTSMLLN